MERERELVSDCLHTETMDPLIDACEDMILRGPKTKEAPNGAYLKYILYSDYGVGYMLEEDKFDDLRNMHKILSGISEQQPMADAMRDHIIDCGQKIILQRAKELDDIRAKEDANAKKDGKKSKKKNGDQNRKTSPNFISSLLDLHRKYINVIHEQFNDDMLFEKALVQAFQQVVSDEAVDHLTDPIAEDDGSIFFVSSNAEMLSHEVDYIYEHTNKYDRDQLETILTECSKLFEFLSERDLFIEFHTQQLALRLLGKKANTDEGGCFFICFSSFLFFFFSSFLGASFHF